MFHNKRTNNLGRHFYPYKEFGLHHPLPRYPSHRRAAHLQSIVNNRHVRRRKKHYRRMLNGGGAVYHQPEDWRGLYNDLILSETRVARPRPHPVYYNRYRGQYYYWDLDPYSVLGEQSMINSEFTNLLTWISIHFRTSVFQCVRVLCDISIHYK